MKNACKKLKSCKKNGFTLLEMIIVLMVTVIIIALATSMFMTGNRVVRENDLKTDIQIESQTIQQEINKIFMSAESVNISSKNSEKIDGNNAIIVITAEPEDDSETPDIYKYEYKLWLHKGGTDKKILSMSKKLIEHYSYDKVSDKYVINEESENTGYIYTNKILSVNVNGSALIDYSAANSIISLNFNNRNAFDYDTNTLGEYNSVKLKIPLEVKKLGSKIEKTVDMDIYLRNKDNSVI